MTIRRFRRRLASYGADLRRWPGDERAAAAALLASSDEARALAERERRLDHALRAAAARTTSVPPAGDGPNAALARLRAGVAARVASPGPTANRRPAPFGVPGFRSGVLQGRHCAFGALAMLSILAGFSVGILAAAPPAAPAIAVLLQAEPIAGLV